jgi:hypothetical protein
MRESGDRESGFATAASEAGAPGPGCLSAGGGAGSAGGGTIVAVGGRRTWGRGIWKRAALGSDLWTLSLLRYVQNRCAVRTVHNGRVSGLGSTLRRGIHRWMPRTAHRQEWGIVGCGGTLTVLGIVDGFVRSGGAIGGVSDGSTHRHQSRRRRTDSAPGRTSVRRQRSVRSSRIRHSRIGREPGAPLPLCFRARKRP